MNFISIKAITIAKNNKIDNLIKCLEAHGLYEPPTAEYKPAAPIKILIKLKKLVGNLNFGFLATLYLIFINKLKNLFSN